METFSIHEIASSRCPKVTINGNRKGPIGQKAYLFLANLFNGQNADQGERLLLLVYFAAALMRVGRNPPNLTIGLIGTTPLPHKSA